MPYPLPLTRTEAYLAYKAGVIQQSDLKPSLAVPRNGIDAWLAYWTGLAADYPKREDGTPHILQEEEAYIAYLCGVINEYPEKCLRRVGAYLRYLISARWGRPDHPLNREELYLSLIKTQVIPSGDPSSDITIEGTCKAPFVDVKMYGDTYQQSYSGSNLSNAVPATSGNLNGLSATIENDGSIHLTGVSTANYSNFLVAQIKILAAGNYVLSVDKNLPFKINFRVVYSDSTAETFYRKSELDLPISLAKQVTAFYIYAGSTISGTTYDETFKVWLSSGATATPFEPYVGGQPSPNPDYPQQIQTVTGEQTITVVGKNLFDKNNYDSLDAYVDGTEIKASVNNKLVWIPCDPGSAYAITVVSSSVSTSVYSAPDIPVVGGTANWLGSIAAGDTTGVFTTKPAAKYIVVRIWSNTASHTVQEALDALQVEAGSTATTYEPYSSNDYEINLGKNLYNGSIYKTDYILSATGSEVYSGGAVITDPIEVEPNTAYTASAIWHSGKGDTYIRIGVYDKSMGWIVRYSGQLNKITFTTPANAGYVRLCYYRDRTDSVQLELGSKATSYAPYFTPIELCKLGDYQDYIWKDGGDWKVHKAIKKIQMADTTSWVKRANGDFYSENWAEINGIRSETGFCSHFIYSTTVWYRVGYYGISSAGNLWLITGDTTLTDTDLFEAWLNTKKPILYQPLATATDTTITDTNLIAQLDSLVNGGAEDGTTYIKVNATDPNLPGLLVVEAPKYE